MSYFSETKDQLAPIALDGKAKYRECPIDAYWDVNKKLPIKSEEGLFGSGDRRNIELRFIEGLDVSY